MARLARADGVEFAEIKALCYRGLDSATLREMVGARLRRYLRADAFAFVALDPHCGLPIHGVHDWPPEMCAAANERVLGRSPVGDFGRRAVGPRRVYFVEELLAPHLGAADPYAAEVLRPFDFHYELQVNFAMDGKPWGNLNLTRRARREQFPGSNLALLAAITPHVTAALQAASIRAALASVPGAGIGMLLLDANGQIEIANGIAERLLERPTRSGRQSYWMAVQVVASFLTRVLAEEAAPLIPQLRIVDPELGEAYQLHAERVESSDGTPRALILIAPGHMPDRMEMLFELGLTRREAEVARAVLHGRRTEEIAAALKISPYTVQDHVRHICDKLGIGSRRELVALLLNRSSPSASHR